MRISVCKHKKCGEYDNPNYIQSRAKGYSNPIYLALVEFCYAILSVLREFGCRFYAYHMCDEDR